MKDAPLLVSPWISLGNRVNRVRVEHSHPSWSTESDTRVRGVPSDGGCHRECTPFLGSSEHCGRPDTHFGGTSKQILFIHDYFQEMHVRTVLDFIKNEGGTVTEASSTHWRNLIHVCDILVSCCLVIHCPKGGHGPTCRGSISVGLKNTPKHRMDGLVTCCCLTLCH